MVDDLSTPAGIIDTHGELGEWLKTGDIDESRLPDH
jgi:hypothetical protein